MKVEINIYRLKPRFTGLHLILNRLKLTFTTFILVFTWSKLIFTRLKLIFTRLKLIFTPLTLVNIETYVFHIETCVYHIETRFYQVAINVYHFENRFYQVATYIYHIKTRFYQVTTNVYQVERIPHVLGGQHNAGGEVADDPADGDRCLDETLHVEREAVQEIQVALGVLLTVGEVQLQALIHFEDVFVGAFLY